jgi:CBS domain containing-hemolysin-like protein
MVLLLFYVSLALAVSFLCSILEAVLLSVTPSYLAVLERKGGSTGPRLRALKDNIDRPLSAILSLNTIAHTVGAAGAGAQATKVFGDAYVGVISAVLTFLILVLSEIIPKSLGANYWRQLAPFSSRLIPAVTWTMWPLVKLSQGITHLISRNKQSDTISREEVAALAEQGAKEGTIEESESRILRSLFRFRQLRARDVMTPRTVTFLLPEDRTIEEVLDENETIRFSRIPIFRKSRDDISGYVLKDDLLNEAAHEREDRRLSELKRDMLVVPDSMLLANVFENLLASKEHIALVIDEYGGMAGIITMEDIVETLLGMEIVDEADSVADMQEMARQQWFKRAQRLGIIPEERSDEEKEAIVKFGMTGGKLSRE